MYLSICGLRKGPGKFLMEVLESPGKVMDFFVCIRPSTTPPVELARSAVSTPEDTSIPQPPTIAEVARAIRKLKAGKAPGICGIPAELLKAGGYHCRVADRGLSERLADWTDAVRLEERNHTPTIQRKG